MPALRRGPNAYDLPLEDTGIPIDQLGDVLPSRDPLPPEVAGLAKTAPQDELRAAQRESDLLRFLSTQGRGFDEAGRIIAGIPGSMQIDLAGTEKPVENVMQRQGEAYKVAQAEAEKREKADALKRAEAKEAQRQKERGEDVEREEKREKARNRTALQAAGISAKDRAAAASVQAQNEQFDREQGLRKEFTALPQVRQYEDAIPAFESVRAAAADPTPAGDLALIFNFMKLLDPGVSVMEGDVANVQNAGGIPDRIRAMYNQAIGGGRLSPDQRADLLKQAGGIMTGRKQRYDEAAQRFQGIAGAAGVVPERVAQPTPPRAAAGPARGFTRVQVADDQPQVDIPNANLGAFQADYPGAKIIARGG